MAPVRIFRFTLAPLGALAVLATSGLLWDRPVTPKPSHVLLVMEENRGYTSVIGSSSAPYINSLAKAYASDAAWYGIRHPSLPNYLATVSGGTWGVTSDCTTCGPFAGPSLGSQLSAAGITWKAYMESMPSACYSGSTSGSYVKRHNPFAYFKDVLGSTCASHVVPFTSFSSDLAGSSPPAFVWVTPNLKDDMHDGTVQMADTWLKDHIGPVLTSQWFTDYSSTVIITMDEHSSDTSGCCGGAAGGRVLMVVVSNASRGKGSLSSTGDLYGTLRSIEKVFSLSLLGAAANSANGDLSAYFGSVATPSPSPSRHAPS